MKEIGEREKLSKDVQVLKKDVSTKIDGINGQMSAIRKDLHDQEANIQALREAVDALESGQWNLEKETKEIKGNVYKKFEESDGKLKSLREEVDNQKTKISSIEDEMGPLATRQDILDQDHEELRANFIMLEKTVYILAGLSLAFILLLILIIVCVMRRMQMFFPRDVRVKLADSIKNP